MAYTYEYLGTLQSTGTSANSNGVAALGAASGLAPGKYLVQADGAGTFAQVDTATDTVAATTGIKIAADGTLTFAVGTRLNFIAWISGAGTTNLRVFRAHS